MPLRRTAPPAGGLQPSAPALASQRDAAFPPAAPLTVQRNVVPPRLATPRGTAPANQPDAAPPAFPVQRDIAPPQGAPVPTVQRHLAAAPVNQPDAARSPLTIQRDGGAPAADPPTTGTGSGSRGEPPPGYSESGPGGGLPGYVAVPAGGFDPRALTDFQLDELTHRLTGRITRLLRTELRLDRERIGRLRDPR
ncbi:hypothetical protein [Spirillospora sp. CA-294931]|uniref:hypothetical protein n=1 Tax=Spirillospora sp. CA-294931 TaxID=3240042 RepID=UPI003D8FDB6E